jgi:hypothetical protein
MEAAEVGLLPKYAHDAFSHHIRYFAVVLVLASIVCLGCFIPANDYLAYRPHRCINTGVAPSLFALRSK